MNRKTFERLKSMGITFSDDFEDLIVKPLEQHREKIELVKKFESEQIETSEEIIETFGDSKRNSKANGYYFNIECILISDKLIKL